MKKLILHIVLIVFTGIFSVKSYGQQDPMYSLYMMDKMLINPGYTGSSNYAVGTVKHRSQFVGMENAPSTQTFNFHMPVNRRKIGLGLKVINDQIAIVKNLNAAVYYSYHLNFAGGKLSAGLETGIYNRTIDYSQVVVRDLGDNAMPTGSLSSLVPDASWGLYYQKKDFYFGIAQNHILGVKFDDYVSGAGNSHLYAHTNIIAGSVFDVANKITLEPSMLLKSTSGAPMQMDLNATVFYDEKFGVGFQYRTGDAFSTVLRVNLNESLHIGYSYDVTLSGLSTYSGGAHEILVSYGIKLPPPPAEKEIHPRFYF